MIVDSFRNPLQELWDAGRTAVNGWIAAPSPITVEAMASASWDTLTVDLQHGTADYSDLLAILPVIEKSGAAPLVRVPWLDEASIMRALDAGALGIIAPMINTAADAQRLVSACLYPPNGERSFGPIRARFAHKGYSVSSANNEVVPFAMIETREAVENLKDILAVQGLGGIYIGPADLSLAHGFPPGFDREEPEMVDLIASILSAANEAHIRCGIHCGSAHYARRMAEKGFSLVTIGSDTRFIEAAAASTVCEFRGKTPTQATENTMQSGTYW